MVKNASFPAGFLAEDFYNPYKNERRGPIKIRLLAMHHLQKGKSLTDVSSFIGEGQETIKQWITWYEQGGMTDLRSKTVNRGRKKKLSPEQESALRGEIIKLQSTRNRKVTGDDIRKHIKKLWGVQFSTGSIYTVLKRL